MLKLLHDKYKSKVSLPILGIPFAGEFTSFSSQGLGLIERCRPNWSMTEYKLGCITSSTPDKPCLRDEDNTNWALIPDLELPEMILFIELFKEMKTSRTKKLMTGNLIHTRKGKDVRIPPGVLKGNFPEAPQQSALGAAALLGIIGKFAKDAKQNLSKEVCHVVEKLKGASMYIVSSDKIHVVSFNDFIVNLAVEGELQAVVNNMRDIELYCVGNRNKKGKNKQEEKKKKIAYQKFDLFAGRFLQLFNDTTFHGFLSFRAEYPSNFSILFKTYFYYMEKIEENVVISAMALGKWLNDQAYWYAKSQVDSAYPLKTNKSNIDEYWEKIRDIKVKVLIQMENSIMSARSGCDLIRYAPEMANRLTGRDIDEEASLFMQKVSAEMLPLEQAKSLLVAFSRLKSANKPDKTNLKS